MSNQYIAKSRRLRSTIYSSRIENQGVTSYTIYNHMLLPAGFEIEDAFVTPPSLSSVGVYHESDVEPDYQANMDDRFVAHFANRLYLNDNILLSYVVRSAYTGEVQIGGAHIEHMYAPEVNGRSGSFRALVIEK